MDVQRSFLASITETSGALMMIAWTLIMGPVGLLLLLGVTYAVISQNLALGVVCGLLMFCPLALTVLWAPFLGLTLVQERWARKAIPAQRTDLVTYKTRLNKKPTNPPRPHEVPRARLRAFF